MYNWLILIAQRDLMQAFMDTARRKQDTIARNAQIGKPRKVDWNMDPESNAACEERVGTLMLSVERS